MKQLSPEIIEAAHNSDIDRIRSLVESGHSLEGTCEEGSDLLFHFIWQCCDLAMLESLLAMGCKPNNKSAKGGTPLVAAIWCNCPKLVKLLLEAGADPNLIAFLKDDENSALDTVLDEYCGCETDEETARVTEIEHLIREAGGQVHSKSPKSGSFPDWKYEG
jgi:hypothetical protein